MRRSWVLAFLLGALPCAALASFDARPASASTAIALSLDDLVEKSEVVVVATPTSKTARWEDGHIVTYTTIAVDAPIGGATKAGDALVVRTLGGVVDKIGQKVFGEAVLVVGTKSILFLRPLTAATASIAPLGARSVTGMEQGVFPVVLGTDKLPRIGPLPTTLDLVPSPTAKGLPARLATQGRLVQDVVADVKALWIAHGKK